jgi:hypothetical protein
MMRHTSQWEITRKGLERDFLLADVFSYFFVTLPAVKKNRPRIFIRWVAGAGDGYLSQKKLSHAKLAKDAKLNLVTVMSRY